MLINNFFKRVSIAELLTILFSISVGISLLYKMGFYNSLGINWYINNLTPQQLFISSIKLIISSITGVLVGFWLGAKISEKQANIVLFVTFPGYIFFAFYGEKIGLSFGNLNMDWFYLFFLNFLVAMFLINSEILMASKKKSLLINVQPPKIDKLEHTLRYLMPLLFILGVTGMPYFSGMDAGKRVLINRSNLNHVILKDNSSDWLLIEMSGDKALLKKNTKEPVFKIIEYKEIKTITVK